MIRNKFNVVLDAQWGSSGKGKLCAFLADKYAVNNASSSNMPNAGHTVQFASGNKYVFKCLPSAVALNAEQARSITAWISPGSSFYLDRFLEEARSWMGDGIVNIHDRAQIMHLKHKEHEQEATKGIASTMQGCASAMCEKIMRGSGVDLVSRHPFMGPGVHTVDPECFRDLSHYRMAHGMWLHEVSQGYALSIDHGTQYPYCTSRNCTTQAAMDQMSVPPQDVGDVYLNFRPYPIRVGNLVENGKEIGYSGDFSPWGEETTWSEVARFAGMPTEEASTLMERERTTVTKRVRRVGTLSMEWLAQAAKYNGVTKLCLNFASYVDWEANGVRKWGKLPVKVLRLVHDIEEYLNLPVAMVGTGANHEDMAVDENAA